MSIRALKRKERQQTFPWTKSCFCRLKSAVKWSKHWYQVSEGRKERPATTASKSLRGEEEERVDPKWGTLTLGRGEDGTGDGTSKRRGKWRKDAVRREDRKSWSEEKEWERCVCVCVWGGLHWIGIRPCCERRKRRKKWSPDSPPSMKCDPFMRNVSANEEEKVRQSERERE